MQRLHVAFLAFLVLISFASLVTMRLPRLRFRSVSLRLVLGLVAIAAVWMGWIVHRVRVQQEGIDLIRRHGGMYNYDFEYDDSKFPKLPRSSVPGRLIKNLGIDYFHHVAYVRIEEQTFDDNDFGRLAACLPRIKSLGIQGTSLTDAGLRHLRRNRALRALWVAKNGITDAGIDNLAPETLPALELLDLHGTDVSAAKVTAVEVLFDARESAAKKAHPGVRISEHMVLTGLAHPPILRRDPRGKYEKSIAAKRSGP
jgi:hypothetical protein